MEKIQTVWVVTCWDDDLDHWFPNVVYSTKEKAEKAIQSMLERWKGLNIIRSATEQTFFSSDYIGYYCEEGEEGPGNGNFSVLGYLAVID